jgi:hypothetical protein
VEVLLPIQQVEMVLPLLQVISQQPAELIQVPVAVVVDQVKLVLPEHLEL